jgi:hypothetical protein
MRCRKGNNCPGRQKGNCQATWAVTQNGQSKEGRVFNDPGQSGQERKQFFFEKKNQKTFAYWARACGQSEGVKVFCFFFSKKKTFL